MSHTHDRRRYDHYIRTAYDGTLKDSSISDVVSLFATDASGEKKTKPFKFLNTVTAGQFDLSSPHWVKGFGEANVTVSEAGSERVEYVSFPFYLFNQDGGWRSWFSWMNGLAIKIMTDYHADTKKCCRFEGGQLAVEVNSDGVYYFWNNSAIKIQRRE